ncbi:MAG: SDR family NAD(P)-dependent oxidoreductase [Acidimicrobiia bacterium]|nr:SDR family NAD(P)-dependent oxidoreductase [Acidimicrobiia bacterium]
MTTAISGDITDAGHRAALVAAAESTGSLDLVVNNASELGPNPLPRLADLALVDLRRIHEVNVVAPLGLIQASLPLLTEVSGTVVNITSDAAIEPYEGWGGYGSSKAGLDQLSRVLAAEHPELRIWWIDPGDMRTDMHQAAFPGEDISDRPLSTAIAPSILAIVAERPPSGRLRAEAR